MNAKHNPVQGGPWQDIKGSRSCIRDTRLDMQIQGCELAGRLGVSPARVSVLERDEQRGAVTLKMMERAAKALGCDFVYALVPRATVTGKKRKLRLDCDYQARSREQQLHDLESRMASSAGRPDADV